MLVSVSQCTSHSCIPSVDCSLGDGIGVTSLRSGVQGSTSGLSLLQALCNLALFLCRLRCSFLSFLDFLLTRFGKSGVVFGLDCPGGGVPSDWFLEQAVGGDKNPVILPCIMITQWALRGFSSHTCGLIIRIRVFVGNTGASIRKKIQQIPIYKSRYFTQFIYKIHNSNDCRILGSWLSNGARFDADGALKMYKIEVMLELQQTACVSSGACAHVR